MPDTATASPGPRSERGMTIVEAMRQVLREEMRRDTDVFVLGEDIVVGGAFLVTLGLAEEMGTDRVINTPISEAGFLGLSIGAAIEGLRPVVDFQYGDFLYTAADQLIQQAAKLRYMSGGQVTIPLVIQLPTGASGRGAQHANSMENLFFGLPGIHIVTPSTPADARGLLSAAIRSDDVVLYIVHKHLYGSRGRPLEHADTSTGDIGDIEVPIGVADVKRTGSDLTVVANHVMVHHALRAAGTLADEGIDVEVIDPRTLVPFDLDTVLASVEKTGRLLVCEENPGRGGWGPWLISQVAEHALFSLDAPVRRLAADDTPIPFSPPLEKASLPSLEGITATIREMCHG
ncbi:alpha-ketoacid dehydrogenase subunit beta [Euzebya tangerina]|uniref:alpha-ketoacid dehydrogenase subunit beta n=1 Tax=Euzebya tangerina TaxID=591198 RepID=UPI00196A907E|nr:alpha-ketoacid dehydrogenase subunit beta [Euzebya tangerina]